MVKWAVIIIILGVGLYSITGKICYNENEYFVMARNALGVEKGCSIYKNLE